MSNLYDQLLQKGKDAIAALERPFKVKKERKVLEMKILEIESEIAKDELTVQVQKSANPINWDSLTKAINNKELNERKLKQYQALEVELFSEGGISS